MVHLFSGLQTAILFFNIATGLCLKIENSGQKEMHYKTMVKNGLKKENITRFQKPHQNFPYRRLNNKNVNKILDNFSMVRKQGGSVMNQKHLTLWNTNPTEESFNTISAKKSFETNSFDTDEVQNSQDFQIINILNKQTILMEKLASVLEKEHNIMRAKNDFEDLLAEMDAKKNKNTTQEVTSTTVKYNRTLSTVMLTVDQSLVRTALKQDPLVQRLLKMAMRKRKNYEKAAKEYYES